jgi:hypothetical protein
MQRHPYWQVLQALASDLNVPLQAAVDLLKMGQTQPPKCPYCGQYTTWRSTKPSKWRTFCTREHYNLYHYGVPYSVQRPAVQEKVKNTMHERYGVSTAFQLSEVQAAAQKVMQEKYGVSFFIQSNEFKEKKITVDYEKIKETRYIRYGTTVLGEINKEKREQTCLVRYGVRNPLASPIIRAKFKMSSEQRRQILEKAWRTYKNRTGFDHPSKNPEIKMKKKATLLARYGTANLMTLPEIKEKIQATNRKKYGVRWFTESSLFKEKVQATIKNRYGVSWVGQIETVREKMNYTRQKMNYTQDQWQKITSKIFWEQEYLKGEKSILQIAKELGLNDTLCGRFLHKYAPNIQIREQYVHSSTELQLKDWVQEQLPGHEVIHKTLNALAKDLGVSIVSRHTLDIYIPHLRLAIEFNGLYWHSNVFHDASYHLGKTKAAEKLGVRLIHIWSDDWEFRQDLVKTKLKYIMGLSDKLRRIHPRECSISVPTKEQKRSFYNANHIKGDGAGSVNYALFHGGIPVAMISLKQVDRSDPSKWDLNRFAVDINYHVPGAFSKLLAHFKRNHAWSSIITYADKCWATGETYLKSGFKWTHDSPPAFHVIKKGFMTRSSRRNYTHDRLRKMFPETYDPAKSQLENIFEAGLSVVYDCGNKVFVLNNNMEAVCPAR